MTTDVIYEEHGSDWSHQVSVVATTRWLQRDQTLPLSVKGVACETRVHSCAVETRLQANWSPREQELPYESTVLLLHLAALVSHLRQASILLKFVPVVHGGHPG